MQLEVFNGNAVVPIDGRIGFGIPAIGAEEPTGPQLLTSDGDPNGAITAPAGTLALDFTTPALWQNTDAATAWALVGMGGATIPVFARTLYVNNNMVVVGPDGSIAKPFPTISGALAAAGSPVDALDQLLPYTLRIASGIYDEHLVLPAYRNVNFVAEGIVILGDAFPPTVPRDITVALTGGSFVSSDVRVNIGGKGESGGMLVTGTFFVTSLTGGGNTEGCQVTVSDSSFQGLGAGGVSGFDATGFVGGGQVKLSGIRSDFFTDDPLAAGVPVIAGPGGALPDPLNVVLIMDRFLQCRFESRSSGLSVTMVAGSYSQFVECQFDGNLTFLDNVTGIVDDSRGLTGFVNCGFAGSVVFTGRAASDFLLDANSNFFFKTSGGTLTAPTTKSIQTDLVP